MIQNDAGTESTRRRQYSSCDLCRQSRIACDASKLQQRQHASSGSSVSGSPSSRIQCTNCSKRAVPCTYEWIRNRGNKNVTTTNDTNKPKTRQRSRRLRMTASRTTKSPEPPEAVQHDEIIPISRTETHAERPSSVLNSDLSRQAEATELHIQLWTVFTEIFEPVLALWTGPDCSPYAVPAHMSGLKVLQLVVSLDWANCACSSKASGGGYDDVPTSHACARCDRAVRLALISSVHAFSLRWLPLVTDNSAIDYQQLMSLGDRLWHNARTKVMAVFDKLSYQTVLAMYLFGLTPIYEGAFLEVGNAHTAGEVSIDMALRQIHRLRVKRQDLKFSGTGVSLLVGGSQQEVGSSHKSVNEDFIHAENMMYWAGVVFDTSAAMTRGSPSILCSGVFGFEEEPVFRLMKARVELFHESTEEWRRNGFAPTSHTTLYIVHRASTWKGYVWKVIGALREAINNGYEESIIVKLRTLLGEALNLFDRTFKPLLIACERHILFLNKEARLCYYLLQLHYYMGLLLLCNLVSSIDRVDIVPNFESVRRESVHAIFSTISFGLSCQVSFNGGESQQRNGNLCSLISSDPYPHHILASLQLAADVLLIYLERDEIAHDAFESCCRIVFDALDQMPQCLVSVQKVKKLLYDKLAKGISLRYAGSDAPSSPPMNLLSLSKGHKDQQGVHNGYFAGGDVSESHSTEDSNQVTSFSSVNPLDVEEAGLGFLDETLFSRPAIVLTTTASPNNT
ncbi:hypothetical protein TARUN_4773 [Trichoderma arundinaceum]|uniref:Zn(2)-C6 fungal-type domain-containing protein n=1 Tax=Trichoderma arundinaceum TaxID=490622 RepID=A0A395NN17_TRIAR|nr:hypothetical protein TARUN_4773 [Trichoderma arundinaceum]